MLNKIEIIGGWVGLLFVLSTTHLTSAQELSAIRGSMKETSKELLMQDKVYEPVIRTVRLQLQNRGEVWDVTTPVFQLNPTRPLPVRLSFDCLSEDAQYYEVQLVHCNADWTPSSLAPIDYLVEYNEFQITDFEYSINTRVPYIHYWFDLPTIKLSGNYLIKVYHEGEEEDLVLTRRIMIYEEGLEVSLQQTTVNLDRTRQQLRLQVNYGNLELNRPRSQIKAVIRQNYRWDNALVGLKPTFINQLYRRLEYRETGGEMTFLSGHEFRAFDLSDLENGGYQVGRIEQLEGLNRVLLAEDKPRKGRAYDKGLFRDRQGGYQIAVKQWNDPRVEADYAEVIFQLETGNPIQDSIYVVGSFCDWERRPELRMKYVASEGKYYAVAFLKQGLYDYAYLTSGDSPATIEGSFEQTRNDYDVLVYYRPFGARGDLLVGYTALVNAR